MTGIDRRTFLGAAGAAALAGRIARSAPASERLRVAVVGLRSRGTDLARLFAKRPDTEVVAVCDIDDSMIARLAPEVEKISGKAPRAEKDFRRLLDDKEVDVIVNATPDHWHALVAVMACQAGKDVYTEKPASHNVVEGRRMVEAARKYKRVVQMGTQRRSMPHVIEAVKYVQSGGIGTVGMARAWILQKRPAIGPGQPAEIPAGVDYAMWQGPALDRPFMSNRFHYNWHWFWNWGTGELGNNGVHGIDVARWGLGVDAPTAVTSGGGLYVFDDREVPDTQIVTWEFPKACIVWEHRLYDKHPMDGLGFGIAFYGDEGVLTVDEKGWKVEDGKEAGGKATEGMSAHLTNFVECVKSRETPNADIEIGHLTTRLCHLGNIAHRVGRKLTFDAATESFPGDSEANALLSREYSSRFEMPSIV
ncbi:Gfo/Idh/MocA family protein [Tundrisphaera lichenicola]|uniref:Gfo/Idh/MocA family protein n=1 Tax=Tundrisphaera lichenicola TaxID=2029860 RepID=UPI003EBA5CE6